MSTPTGKAKNHYKEFNYKEFNHGLLKTAILEP